VFGGTTTAGSHVPSKAVDSIKVDNGTFTVTTATDMQVARELPDVQTCGGNPIAFGGLDSNGKGIKDVETASNAVPDGTTTWTNQANKMPYAAGNFAVVKVPGVDKYIASGGSNGTPTIQSKIWGMDGTSSCTSLSTVDVTGLAGINLSHAVEGQVGFYKSNTGGAGVVDTVTFATGRQSTTTLETDATDVTINWGTPASSSTSVATGATQGHYRPSIIQSIISGTTKYTFVDGANAADSAGVSDVDQYVIGTGWATKCSTSVAHQGPFSWFDGSDVFTVGDAQLHVEKTTP
jgi:hypothetical protein